MAKEGQRAYVVGCLLILFVWLYIMPVVFPITPPWDMFLGIALVWGYYNVCYMSFPKKRATICKNCGYEWDEKDVPEDLQYIEQCPECPEPEEPEDIAAKFVEHKKSERSTHPSDQCHSDYYGDRHD